MKYLTNMIQKLFSKKLSRESILPLGRWNIHYCDLKIDRKVDLSNEDHCGSCGEYMLTKQTKELTKVYPQNK